jgi:hypothetical protein
MADESKTDINSLLFTQLVMSFQAAAWQFLGKIAGPIDGKIERKLDLAKNYIDLLGMIEVKTQGNLSEDEQKFLQQTLSQLRLNYVEEVNKPPANDKKNDSPDRERSGPA